MRLSNFQWNYMSRISLVTLFTWLRSEYFKFWPHLEFVRLMHFGISAKIMNGGGLKFAVVVESVPQ